MICFNHLVKEVVLYMKEDKLNCWTQSKRVFQDLVRINRISDILLTYPPMVQVYISTLPPSQPPSSLPSTAMKGANQNPSTQAAKPSKTKSKLTTSSVSQKAGVVKSTAIENVKDRGKVSENVQPQPTHSVPSQKRYRD